MRLAIFADIHGNLPAFEAALADFARVGEVDKVWFLGDYVAFGTQPAECIALIRALIEQHGKDKVQVIGGNTDRYVVTGKRPASPPAKDAEGLAKRLRAFQERDAVLNWTLERLSWEDYEFLAGTLGRELSYTHEGYGTIIGFHAIPGDDEPPSLTPNASDEQISDALLDREGRLALSAHTHLVMNRQVGRWQVVNAGSVGMSFSQAGYAEWALITLEGAETHVDLRAVPYDMQAVIASAQALGFPHPHMVAERLKTKITG